jgi:FdhE protein
MTIVGKSQGAAIDIGEVAAPPFVRLPVPQTMFAERAVRLRTLASSHALADALAFFAAIAEAQHAVQSTLAPPAPAAPAQHRPKGRGAWWRTRTTAYWTVGRRIC